MANREAKPRVSEHQEQANFISDTLFRYANCETFVQQLLFAVPNGSWFGGSNPWAMYNKFSAEGFRKGVADLLYLQPRGEYAYLAIEMKAVDVKNHTGAISNEQSEFLAMVNTNGGKGVVCYGCEEAVQVFEWYMELEGR